MGNSNAIGVQSGTQLTLSGSAVVENAGVGLAVSGPSAGAKLTSTIIRDTTSSASGTDGNGISTIDDATLEVETSWFLRDADVAILIGGGTATVDGSTVYDTQPDAMNQFGAGIGAEDGAVVTITSSAVAKSLYYGVFAADAKTTVSMSHTLVRDTSFDHIDGVGRNVDVQDGAKVTLNAVTVVNSEGEALLSDATMAAADLNATETLAIGGHIGAFVRLGGTMELTGSALVKNIEAALYLTADEGAAKAHSKATATDSVFLDTQTIKGANGNTVVSGGIVSLERVTIDSAYGIGVLVGNNTGPDGGYTSSGSTATLDGCVVRDTQPEPNGSGPGHGVVALAGTTVNVTGSTITGNTGAGLAFQSATGLVSGGTVSNNVVGIDVQGSSTLMQLATAPATLSAGEVVVLSDTDFTGNQQTLSSMVLPLPNTVLMP
jgi:hypothetical protein